MGRNKIILLLACGLFASSISYSNGASETFAYSSPRNLFTYSSPLFKQKEGYVDSSTNKKGLLLYGYQEGMEAEFNSPLSGVFSAEFLTILDNGNPGVPSYSLTFENSEGSSFKIGVNSSSSYNEVYVQYESQKAGIRYYTVDWSQQKKTVGYTASFNSNNQYSIFDGNYIKLQFDPSSMVVSASDGTNSLKIWDFSSTFNDGMMLENDLGSFSDYRVKITLDKLSSYSASPLLLLSFGGYSFSTSSIQAKTTISASIQAKAVLNCEYTLPKPLINNPFEGDIDPSLAKVSVYDSNKNLIGNSYSFVPNKLDTYYVYYEYDDNGTSISCLEKIPCIESSQIDSNFSFEEEYVLDLNNTFGLNSSIYLPKAKVTSSSFSSSLPTRASIEIKKDGVVDDSFIAGGGSYYTFSSYGNYEIKYYSPISPSICDIRYVNVNKDTPGIKKDNISPTYKYNSMISLSQASIYIGEEEIKSNAKIVYPSCREAIGSGTLDEIGLYKVRYQYSYNGKTDFIEDYFLVNDEYSSYFKGEKSYANFGVMSQNNQYSGVELTLYESSSLVYEKTIDLSDNTFDENLDNYEDNTKLVEIRSAPHASGSKDAERLFVVLTDETNPNNQISIRMIYLSYMPNFARIRAKATGQGWAGNYYDFDTGNLYSVDNSQVHEDGGFISNFNFTNGLQDRDFSKTSLQLYFDNDTGRLYANPWQNYGTKEGYKDNRVSWLVRDFSSTDRLLSGGDDAWTGFTSGKVKLSIYATGISTSASFFVTNIDGEDLSQGYRKDESGPLIELPSSFPDGEVGKVYKIPEAILKDESNVSSSRVDVYKGNTLVSVGESEFIPSSSGKYTLSYVASDYFGNISTAQKEVNILSSTSPIEISLTSDVQESAYLGEKIKLPEPIVTGGVGNYDIKISASSNNEEAKIEDNYLFIEKTTPYTIRYTVRDYANNFTRLIKRITLIECKNEPIFDFDSINLPSSFLEGDGYDLSSYKGKLYSSDGKYNQVAPVITVKDGKGERQINPESLYFPSISSEVNEATITFAFGTNSKTFIVPIVKITQKIGFMANYFAGENVSSIEALDEGVKAKGNENGLSFGFIRSVASKEFSLLWNSSLDDYCLTLVDSKDPSICVDLTFSRRKGNLLISNGEDEIRIFETTDNDVGLSYKESANAIFDSRGNFLLTLSKDRKSNDFNGFSSKMFYFKFTSLAKNSEITIKNIDNQIINSSRRDSSGPYLFINGSLSGRYVLNSNILLPDIDCFDVLGQVSSASVTISVDGKVLKQEDISSVGEYFTPTELGTYKVSYSFKDSSSNTSTYSFYFYVYDDVIPMMELTSTLNSEVKVGDILVLPSYSIIDQKPETVRVDIFILDSLGNVDKINSNSSYKFSNKGKYVLSFLLSDENGNTNFYHFEINAK